MHTLFEKFLIKKQLVKKNIIKKKQSRNYNSFSILFFLSIYLSIYVVMAKGLDHNCLIEIDIDKCKRD